MPLHHYRRRFSHWLDASKNYILRLASCRETQTARCCYIIPPLVVLALAPFALEESHSTYTVVVRIAGIYALFALAAGLGAVFTFIFNYYNTYENKRKLPLKGLVNVAIGVVWIIIVILSVSVALDKSPGLLLTGLGAFAAALMLVFKDSILGFVAGIQL